MMMRVSSSAMDCDYTKLSILSGFDLRRYSSSRLGLAGNKFIRILAT